MNSLTKKVRDYYLNKSNLFNIDTEMLDLAVRTLTSIERAVLENGESEDDKVYNFVLHKVFYRHNDLCAGSTDVDDSGCVLCSAQSSITELDITMDTFTACYDLGFLHIEDINKENFAELPYSVLANLTAAIIIFAQEQQVDLD